MGSVESILSRLLEVRGADVDPSTGRLFTYIYETGDEELKRLARKAFELFLDTNALDPTVFKSALYFEKEIVAFSKSLVRAPEGTVGTVTYGGTESIMLAVKAARWAYRKRRGADSIPEVVLPVTGHPSIRKAAHYLSMRVVEAPVDPGSKKVDVEAVKEAVNDKTSLVVVSAPNFPYGVVDPVRDVAEYARDKGVPVHVDACVGGFILPFLEDLGERIEPFDFRVDGVTSLSMDAHKYGYTPKGVSIVLFRREEYKEGTIYVDLRWPGYPFINTTVLSSRSAAPLAAAWSVFNYLGREGYLEMARRVLSARAKLYEGLRRLGFSSVAPIESPLLSLSLPSESDLFKFHAGMSLRGWVIGLQPRVEGVAPYNIHLTISPVHDRVAGEFLSDAKDVLEGPPPGELARIYKLLEEDPLAAAGMIGETPLDSIIIAKVLESLPGELAEEMARRLTVEVFK